jgi:hypothetical protein
MVKHRLTSSYHHLDRKASSFVAGDTVGLRLSSCLRAFEKTRRGFLRDSENTGTIRSLLIDDIPLGAFYIWNISMKSCVKKNLSDSEKA